MKLSVQDVSCRIYKISVGVQLNAISYIEKIYAETQKTTSDIVFPTSDVVFSMSDVIFPFVNL